MTAMDVRRLTPAERKPFKPRHSWEAEAGYQCGEPALGTLEQRLEIIYSRLGRGRWPLRTPSMSPAEREEYARWCAEQGVANPFGGAR